MGGYISVLNPVIYWGKLLVQFGTTDAAHNDDGKAHKGEGNPTVPNQEGSFSLVV